MAVRCLHHPGFMIDRSEWDTEKETADPYHTVNFTPGQSNRMLLLITIGKRSSCPMRAAQTLWPGYQLLDAAQVQ